MHSYQCDRDQVQPPEGRTRAAIAPFLVDPALRAVQVEASSDDEGAPCRNLVAIALLGVQSAAALLAGRFSGDLADPQPKTTRFAPRRVVAAARGPNWALSSSFLAAERRKNDEITARTRMTGQRSSCSATGVANRQRRPIGGAGQSAAQANRSSRPIGSAGQSTANFQLTRFEALIPLLR